MVGLMQMAMRARTATCALLYKKIKGTVSYSSQESWIFNNSVRNNILFGREYNEDRYKRVIEVCALERDLQILPFGDKTLVGEKGVQLSGGQKARVNLARALYKDSDIILMDDPLSAVDAPVAQHIFDKCIEKFLANKIRILVTHQIQFVRKATQILVLNEGVCIGLGTYDELQAQGLDFNQTLADQERELHVVYNDAKREQNMIEHRDVSSNESATLTELLNTVTPGHPKIMDEHRESGSIKGHVYWEYIKAGAGPLLITMTILSTILSQAMFNGSDLWLAHWTDQNQNVGYNAGDSYQKRDIIIYAALIGGLFVTTLMRSTAWFAMSMRASINLHNNIFNWLLRAPMTVFDSYPIVLLLINTTQWGVRQSTELESQMTSVERIVEYSRLPQEAPLVSPPNHPYLQAPPSNWPSMGQISFKNVSLYYEMSDYPVLKNISCTINSGEKVGIVGRTGAGKSSLISALFRMTEPIGVVEVDGIDTKSIGLNELRQRISIIPQESVVFTGTVRRNLDPFGEYSDSHIWKALENTQLLQVVNELPGQLDGELSEGGGNLSVGQRQLICLARAILRDNKILVLDEATANVDSHTDALIQQTIRHKFANCTVLTIAHRLNTIIDCDRVLVLDAGEIKEFDAPYVLLQRKAYFYDMCRKTGREMCNHLIQLAKEAHLRRYNTMDVEGRASTGCTRYFGPVGVKMGWTWMICTGALSTMNLNEVLKNLKTRAVFVTMTLFNTLRTCITYNVPKVFETSSELYVSCKRIQDIPYYTLDNISAHLKPGDLLAVIGTVGSGKSSFLMTLLRELPVLNGGIHVTGTVGYASQEAWIFNNNVRNNILFGMNYDEKRYSRIIEVCALERDLQVLPFGDKTLVGEKGVQLSGGQKARVTLARNTDIILMDDPLSAVDSVVAEHIFDKCICEYLADKIRILVTHQIQFVRKATQILVLNEGQCIVLSQVIFHGSDIWLANWTDRNERNDQDINDQNRGIIIYAAFVGALFVTALMRSTTFFAMSRSPIYSHVSTTLHGLSSIRAYGAQQMFEKQLYVYLDDHSATWFLFICASRSLGMVVDWLCVLYLVTISVVLMSFPDNVSAGGAGLAFSSVLALVHMTQWGVRQTTELESQMTSVERIVEYSKLSQEAPLVSPPNDPYLKPPPLDWPPNGQIVFKNVNLFYQTSNTPMLKNMSFTIKPGEKVGIVGRTGAGKSSLISALFRMTEPTGVVEVDGVDTKSIGLNELRRRISIIPQEPVVFTGTVRRNLDPFAEFTDSQIWEALDETQLRHTVNELPGQLDGELREGGGNLSVGQRQLVCLARAILRDNKILVLDEATANVDLHTDELIQQTIRHKFANCTVLTIAHRLNTIIDCDRVLVLDAGEIKELDAPYVLLQRKAYFYDMCRKTGREMCNHLIQMAKEAHLRHYNT
ncbi:unnamed protein product, partial [Oppiella nova]